MVVTQSASFAEEEPYVAELEQRNGNLAVTLLGQNASADKVTATTIAHQIASNPTFHGPTFVQNLSVPLSLSINGVPSSAELTAAVEALLRGLYAPSILSPRYPQITLDMDNFYDRPSHYDYILLCEDVYRDVPNPPQGWTRENKRSFGDYTTAGVYKHTEKKQLVLVFRGLDFNKLSTIAMGRLLFYMVNVADIKSFLPPSEFYAYLREIISVLSQTEYEGFHFSTTGHSLGSVHAEMTSLYCGDKLNYPDVNCVTFEGVGSSAVLKGTLDRLEALDSFEYLTDPSMINKMFRHNGTIFHLSIPRKETLSGNYALHMVDTIANEFRRAKGNPSKYRTYDWPPGQSSENLVIDSSERRLELRHFRSYVRHFLEKFFLNFEDQIKDTSSHNKLKNYWTDLGIDPQLFSYLLGFDIPSKYVSSHVVLVLTMKGISIEEFRRVITFFCTHFPDRKNAIVNKDTFSAYNQTPLLRAIASPLVPQTLLTNRNVERGIQKRVNTLRKAVDASNAPPAAPKPKTPSTMIISPQPTHLLTPTIAAQSATAAEPPAPLGHATYFPIQFAPEPTISSPVPTGEFPTPEPPNKLIWVSSTS